MSKTSRVALRAYVLAAVLALSSAMSVIPNPLFAREDTCGDASQTKCSQAGLPAGFCCKTGTACIPLAGNTTVLCCPDGADGCGVIAAIVCDLALQDPSQNPTADVKTSALKSKLPTCGSNCCPFGYSCDEDQNCVMDEDQSKKPGSDDSATTTSAKSTASKPTATSTSGGKSSASASATSSADSTATAAPSVDDPEESGASGTGSTGAIVGAVVGGVVGLIVIVVGIMCVRNRGKKEEDPAPRKEISAPIPTAQEVGRTDFVYRQPSERSSMPQHQENPFDDNSHNPFDDGNHYNNGDHSNDAANRYSNGHQYDDEEPRYTGKNPFSREDTYSRYTSGVSSVDYRSYHDSAIIDPLGRTRPPNVPAMDSRWRQESTTSAMVPFGLDHGGDHLGVDSHIQPEQPIERRQTTWTDLVAKARDPNGGR